MSEQFKICSNEKCPYSRPAVSIPPPSDQGGIADDEPTADVSKASPLASFHYGREVTPVIGESSDNVTWSAGPIYLVLVGQDGNSVRLDESQIDRLMQILDRGLFPKEECPVTAEMVYKWKRNQQENDQERKS